METQADFELTAEEIAELKALLELKANTSSCDNGVSFNLRRKLVAITDPVKFKKCLSELKSLDLVDENLINNTLPDSIRYLSNLEWLSISGEKLTKLPESTIQLHNLRHIIISGSFSANSFQFLSSGLTQLPENIGQFKQLEQIRLVKCNNIKGLPESIGELSNLKELFLACENLTMLPESISKLNHLQKLTIKGNIIRLPENIGKLYTLKELHLFDCNSLTTLPENIGQLHNLELLSIRNCINLIELPESIAQLKNLILFQCTGCEKLKTVPDGILKMEQISIDRTTQKTKQLTAEQVSIVLAELHKQTAQPAVKINIQEADNLPLTASKFGGVPYWLPETPYPVDKQGNKLLLLAQINLSEMPPLPDFPTTGLLQFLMTRNIYEMNFYDNPTRQDDWRVVYHAEINPAIDEQSVLALNIPYAPQIFDEEDDGGFPVDTQYRLSFEPAEIRIGTECIGFNQALKNAAKEVGIKLNKNDLSDLEVLFGEKAWEKIKQHNVENLIGGYPDFTQTDPRDERKYKKHSVLLLQIESDEGIMWGDCGVGNFFIRPDDLRKKDFSKVLFHWDCF